MAAAYAAAAARPEKHPHTLGEAADDADADAEN